MSDMKMAKAGLVLEGGGMRGIYTAGVLQYFLEQDLFFRDIYGVSAGACHMCSYISKQSERAYRVAINYLKDKNYCSVRNLITTGDLFGADFCYDKIPNQLDPYDYEAFNAYPGRAYAVVTNVLTGKPEYKLMREMHRDIVAVRASASLPLVSRFVYMDGVPYLDGGISDAIPIIRSLRDGNRKNIVVLTKQEGYIRKPTSEAQMEMLKMRYRKYPNVVKDMAFRDVVYNRTMEFVEEHEKKGHIFVFRPSADTGVGRVEKNADKLRELYNMGYADAKNQYDALLAYLKMEK